MALKELQDKNWNELTDDEKLIAANDYIKTSVDSRNPITATAIKFLYGEDNITKFLNERVFINKEYNFD